MEPAEDPRGCGSNRPCRTSGPISSPCWERSRRLCPVSRRIDMRLVLPSLLILFPFPARADDDFREFKGHDGPVRVVRFTPDGSKLVSGSGFPYGDGTVRVWDAKTGTELL